MSISPRFCRGDKSPLRPGLMFYCYNPVAEYWVTPERFEQLRKRDNRLARAGRRQNPERYKKAFAKWLAKPGNSEVKRQCYKNWVAKPEGRKVRRAVTARYIATVAGTVTNRVRSRIWHALEKGVQKSAKTEILIGCTLAELRQHLEGQFLPGMTWDNMGRWEIDHIVPLALFRLEDPEQQRLAFHFRNQRPLWKLDNRAKSDFIEHDGRTIRARELRKVIPFKKAA